MNVLRDYFMGAVAVLGVVLVAAGIVAGIDALTGRESRQRQIEADFRSACATAKGNAVWNGKHWECLK